MPGREWARLTLVFLFAKSQHHSEPSAMGLYKRLIGCIMVLVDSDHEEAEVPINR